MDRYQIRVSEKAYEIISRVAFERRMQTKTTTSLKQIIDEMAEFYVEKKGLSKSMFPAQK